MFKRNKKSFISLIFFADSLLNKYIFIVSFIFSFTATYTDAANACKMYIADSNYETDNQLGKGFRKKKNQLIWTLSHQIRSLSQKLT